MPDNNSKRLEREALESLVADDLSAKMKQWRAPNQPPPSGKRKWIFLLLGMLLVFGGVAWLFWPRTPQQVAPAPQAPEIARQEPTPPAPKNTAPNLNYAPLARQHYRLPDFSSQIRGNQPDNAANIIQQAQTALNARQYAQVLSLLAAATPEYQTEALYLRGHACFGLKQYNQAATHFQALETSVRYGELASWYLQLAKLAANPDSAPQVKKQLQTIAQTEGHTCQQEAAQLLQALK